MHRWRKDTKAFIEDISVRHKISFVMSSNERCVIHGSWSIIQNGIPWIDDRPMVDRRLCSMIQSHTDMNVAKYEKVISSIQSGARVLVSLDAHPPECHKPVDRQG